MSNSLFDAIHDSFIKDLNAYYPTQTDRFISEFALVFLIKFHRLEDEIAEGRIDIDAAFCELLDLCNKYR